MHLSIAKRFIICVTPFLLIACDPSASYRGDGKFTDRGASTAHHRYRVDLGLIDLSKPNRQSFNLARLPHVEFTMGLTPANVSGGCDATALSAVRVRLDIKTDGGLVVVAEEGPLDTWVTSVDLIYRRGVEREEPKADDVFELIRTNVRASGGWGTYFTPQSSAAYVAEIEVLEANDVLSCSSHLVLLGGGWK